MQPGFLKQSSEESNRHSFKSDAYKSIGYVCVYCGKSRSAFQLSQSRLKEGFDGSNCGMLTKRAYIAYLIVLYP